MSLREKLEQSKRELEEGKKTPNQIRGEWGLPPIGEAGDSLYISKSTKRE